jgi:hypothetical protein
MSEMKDFRDLIVGYLKKRTSAEILYDLKLQLIARGTPGWHAVIHDLDWDTEVPGYIFDLYLRNNNLHALLSHIRVHQFEKWSDYLAERRLTNVQVVVPSVKVNAAILSELMLESFGEAELRSIIYYQPAWVSLYRSIAGKSPLQEIVEKTVVFVIVHDQVDALLEVVKNRRPERYPQYASSLYT